MNRTVNSHTGPDAADSPKGLRPAGGLPPFAARSHRTDAFQPLSDPTSWVRRLRPDRCRSPCFVASQATSVASDRYAESFAHCSSSSVPLIRLRRPTSRRGLSSSGVARQGFLDLEFRPVIGSNDPSVGVPRNSLGLSGSGNNLPVENHSKVDRHTRIRFGCRLLSGGNDVLGAQAGPDDWLSLTRCLRSRAATNRIIGPCIFKVNLEATHAPGCPWPGCNAVSARGSKRIRCSGGRFGPFRTDCPKRHCRAPICPHPVGSQHVADSEHSVCKFCQCLQILPSPTRAKVGTLGMQPMQARCVRGTGCSRVLVEPS